MSRTAIAVLLVVLAASTAFANPIIGEWLYVDFDPPEYEHWAMPQPYTMVQGYIVLNLEYGWPEGVSSVSFKVDIVPWPATEPTFQTYLPLSIAEGDWREGVTVSFGECVQAMGPTPIGSFEFLYEGGTHDVLILDHPDHPRWLLDCSEPPQVLIYCVLSHGSVGKMNPMWGDCGVDAVEDLSWGSIKGLYR
jgi:hypothetical protein